MDLIQLSTFLAIADTGSFSAASEQLHSVQSNITARIRKLEDELGGMLFDRGRAGARLTPLGARLVPHARDILARIDAARAELIDATGNAAPLRIGALETTAGSRLPKVLRALANKVPNAEIQLVTGPTGVLTRKVWDRQIDCALVVGAVDQDRFKAAPVFDEVLVSVEAAEEDGENRLLAFADGCSYRAAAQEWLRDTGRADTPIRDFGSLEAILGCVSAGMGFAVAPESAVRRYSDPETLKITPLDDGHTRSITSLIRRHDTARTGTLAALEEILESRSED